MKTTSKLPFLMLVLLQVSVLAHAQGTAFNYQGRLVENGGAANGTYDFAFTLYDAELGGNSLGAAIEVGAVPVSAGQFVVSLDFGANVFTGKALWAEIGVRPNGAANYSTLAPRQALLPTPYAIYAGSAGGVASGSVTANQLNTGGIGDLLTTSNMPGHAMKVSDFTKSQGAILGKAMSGLKDGQGMVLVLVTLQ